MPDRRLDVAVPEAEFAARRPSEAAAAGYAAPGRGWQWLYVNHVLQPDRGADPDFPVGSSGSNAGRQSH